MNNICWQSAPEATFCSEHTPFPLEYNTARQPGDCFFCRDLFDSAWRERTEKNCENRIMKMRRKKTRKRSNLVSLKLVCRHEVRHPEAQNLTCKFYLLICISMVASAARSLSRRPWNGRLTSPWVILRILYCMKVHLKSKRWLLTLATKKYHCPRGRIQQWWFLVCCGNLNALP